VNALNKGICMRSASALLLNQWYIPTCSLIPKLYAIGRLKRRDKK